MPTPEGKITFAPLTVLRLDGAVLESDTVSAQELHDFIITSTDVIGDHVERAYQRDISTARNPATKERIVVHAARLALHQFDRDVINNVYQQEVEAINTLPHILTAPAREYWDAVSATSFRPEVRVRGIRAQEGTSGVWIALKKLR